MTLTIRALLATAAMLAAGGTLGACGSEDGPSSGGAKEVTAGQPASTSERPVLELPDRGHAIVQVRRGERVALHASPGGRVIKRVGDETEFRSRTAFAIQRREGEWAAVPTPIFENGRLVWLRLDPRKLRAYWTPYSVEVDLSEFRVDLIRGRKVVRSFAASIGMPEAPTPTGTFAVTDTFRGGLNDSYGCCAVALTARQTRLPSGWLGGDRIAIHGTSGPLGAEISHGCVRTRDQDVSELVDRLPPGTPVTITQ